MEICVRHRIVFPFFLAKLILFHFILFPVFCLSNSNSSFCFRLKHLTSRLPKVLGKALPWLEKQFSKALMMDLNSLLDGDVLNELYSKIGGMLSNFQFCGEESILEELSNILCIFTRMDPCPARPSICDPHCSWDLKFNFTKNIPLTTVSWNLGRQLAMFDVKCPLAMQNKFFLQLTFVIDRIHGFSIQFKEREVFTYDGNVDISSCSLYGQLGFLGAELDATGGLSVGVKVTNTSGNWDTSFALQAQVKADAIVGLAGKGKDIAGRSDIKALPQVRWVMNVDWKMNNANLNIQPTNFNVSQAKFCIGTSVGKFLKPYITKITDILKPLDPVIGPDGLLLKRLPMTDLLTGKDEMTTIQFLAFWGELFCEDCRFENVEQFLEFVATVQRVSGLLNTFAETECASFSDIRDFIVDFPSGIPQLGPEVDRTPKFTSGISPEQRRAIIDVLTDFDGLPGKRGGLGFTFDFFKNPVQYIIQIMMGNADQVPIFSVTIPRLEIQVGLPRIPIPVWPVPPIVIYIEIKAGIVVDIGAVVLTARGLAKAIQSKSPAEITKALALPVYHPDGRLIRQFTAFVEVTGSAAVTVWILEAGVFGWLYR